MIVRQFLQYTLVGSLGGMLHLALVFSLTEWLGMWYMFSVAASAVTVLGVNFTLNRMWTFRVRNQALPSSTPVLATDGWHTGACWKPAAVPPVPSETYHPV